MTITAEVYYATGGHSGMLVAITAESFICNWRSFRKLSDHHCLTSYATGGRLESITGEVSYATGLLSGRLVTITAEVS